MKRMKHLLANTLLVASVAAMVSCNNPADDGAANADAAGNNTAATGDNANRYAEATLGSVMADTAVTGTARFEQMDNGKVKMNLELTVPTKANQEVAVHIHEHGDCGDSAKAAHGHWNPTGAAHGKWGEGAFHAGDIGNVKLDGSGKGSLEMETDLWSIGGDSTKNILNKALMVHGGVDDYKTQPTGNAGSRIGCAVIMAKNQ
jgi:Cu-Zn family superoxide dismutase